MLNDLRIALRGLRRSPGLAAVAVLVIGLGIGAAAVVFTLLDGFLFRPLDFAAPERLVRLFGTQESSGRERQNVTEAAFFEWRRRAGGFEGLAAARNTGLAVTESETPQPADARGHRRLLRAARRPGIYAVLAAAVAERTREVGIRVAVGARRGDVLAMVLADAGRLALAGIAAGLVLAAAASRLLAGQLQGVGTLDPATYAAVSALLLAVALAAGAVPALRAKRIDPVTALRSD